MQMKKYSSENSINKNRRQTLLLRGFFAPYNFFVFFVTSEQPEQGCCFLDLAEVDAEGLQLDEDGVHVNDLVPDERLEEDADQPHHAALFVFVVVFLTALFNASDNVEVDELVGQLHRHAQPVHHLHGLKGHFHINESSEVLLYHTGANQHGENLDRDQRVVIHQMLQLCRFEAASVYGLLHVGRLGHLVFLVDVLQIRQHQLRLVGIQRHLHRFLQHLPYLILGVVAHPVVPHELMEVVVAVRVQPDQLVVVHRMQRGYRPDELRLEPLEDRSVAPREHLLPRLLPVVCLFFFVFSRRKWKWKRDDATRVGFDTGKESCFPGYQFQLNV